MSDFGLVSLGKKCFVFCHIIELPISLSSIVCIVGALFSLHNSSVDGGTITLKSLLNYNTKAPYRPIHSSLCVLFTVQ